MKPYRSTKIIAESRKGRAAKWGGWLIHVPFIRIRGRWLEAAGFNTPALHLPVCAGASVGDNLRIKIEPGKLTLTKES